MNIKPVFILLIIFFSCAKEKKKMDYSLYEKMDKSESISKKLRPRRKATIPFSYNQIYDPFLKRKKGRNKKSSYKKGKYSNIRIIVLDTIKTNINVTTRKSRREKFAQGLPVIIENNSQKKTMSIPLHKGCAKLIQEAKNKHNEWVKIENFTKEKIGDFYYKISPMEYIYTKIPVYEGSDTTSFRVALMFEDTTLYSNTFTSTLQKWMLRK